MSLTEINNNVEFKKINTWYNGFAVMSLFSLADEKRCFVTKKGNLVEQLSAKDWAYVINVAILHHLFSGWISWCELLDSQERHEHLPCSCCQICTFVLV